MMKCVQCGAEKFETTTEKHSIEVGKHVFHAHLPVRKCITCGESYLAGEILERFELEVACRLADAGLSSGEVFRFMRKTLGLRAVDLAELLAVAAETISRWETEARAVDRGALAVLGAMVSERLEGRMTTLDRLRSLRKPAKLARTVRVEMQTEELRRIRCAEAAPNHSVRALLKQQAGLKGKARDARK